MRRVGVAVYLSLAHLSRAADRVELRGRVRHLRAAEVGSIACVVFFLPQSTIGFPEYDARAEGASPSEIHETDMSVFYWQNVVSDQFACAD